MAGAAKQSEGGGLEFGELKKFMILSRKRTVHLALGNEGGNVILQMDKIKKGPQLRKALEEGCDTKPKDIRWGTVDCDTEDRSRAIFTLNKPVGGLSRRLVKALKRTGFRKVTLRYEDGTPEESEESNEPATDEEMLALHEPDDEEGEQPAAQAGGGTDSAAVAQPPAAAQPPAGPEQANGQGPATGPAQGNGQAAAGLATAGSAQTSGQQQAQGDPMAGAKKAAPTIAKAHDAWVGVHTKLMGNVDKLKAEFSKAFGDHDMQAQILKAFNDRVDPIVHAFDASLGQALDGINAASSPEERQKSVAAALSLMQKYQQLLQMDKTIQELDKNPFVDVSLQQTFTDTIKVVQKYVQQYANV